MKSELAFLRKKRRVFPFEGFGKVVFLTNLEPLNSTNKMAFLAGGDLRELENS